MKQDKMKKIVFRNLIAYFIWAFFLSLVAISYVTFFTYDELDNFSEAESKEAVERALSYQKRRIGQAVTDLVESAALFNNLISRKNQKWVDQKLGVGLFENQNISFTVITDPKGGVVDYFVNGKKVTKNTPKTLSFQVSQAISVLDEPKKKVTSHVSFMRLGGKSYLVSTAKVVNQSDIVLTPDQQRYIMLGMELDSDFMKVLSDLSQIKDIQLFKTLPVTLLEDYPFIEIKTDDEILGYLLWTSRTFSSEIFTRILPAGISIVLLLLLLGFFVMRKVLSSALNYESLVEKLNRTSATLKDVERKSEISNHKKNQFMSNMSHEIRTPMNGISGMISLLQDTELDNQQKDYVNTMQKSSDSLIKLLDDLLEFSKLDSDNAELDTKTSNIRAAVMQVQQLLLPLAQNKSLILETSFDDKIPETVNIDEMRIKQVLSHLVSNGIKFTGSGTIKIRVSIEPHDHQSNELIFQVIDTGAGISDAVKDKLFDDFYQVDSSVEKQYDGVGIGLSIVKKMVKLMNGKVGVESALGQGSIFWFSIPIKNSIDLQPTMPEKPLVLSFPPNIQALLIEENPVTQELLMSILTKSGLKSIVVVQTRLQGLEKIKNHYYDLVVLNISQKVNGQLVGLALVEELRKVGGQNPEMAIMGVSKDMDEQDAQASRQAGVNAYIHQPLNRQQISLAIKTLIDNGFMSDNGSERVA